MKNIGQSTPLIQLLISQEEISTRTREIATQINQDYRGESLHVICLLKGAFIFCADLVRLLTVDTTIDFIKAESYFNETVSSGNVTVSIDLSTSFADKHLLVIDDIIDSGYTMAKIKQIFGEQNPRSLAFCVLLDKPSRRKTEVFVKYIGFPIEDQFVVGYGMDYQQKYRNLPYIGVITD